MEHGHVLSNSNPFTDAAAPSVCQKKTWADFGFPVQSKRRFISGHMMQYLEEGQGKPNDAIGSCYALAKPHRDNCAERSMSECALNKAPPTEFAVQPKCVSFHCVP